MDEYQIIKELKNNRVMVTKNINPRKTSGVYAIFLNEGSKLGETPIGNNQIIYIGKTSNLRKRNHFTLKSSSRSSPRKTIGAILKKNLNLVSVNDRSSYKFSNDSEEELRNWMKNNMEYSYFILEKHQIKLMEGKLMSLEKPILNIDGSWDNPNSDLLNRLRIKCKEEAIY